MSKMSRGLGYIIIATLLTITMITTFTNIASAASSKGYKHYSIKGEFSDILQDVKDAIIDRGFKIDYEGHVDKMLERTSEAVGSVTEYGVKSPLLHAKYLHFCSAKLTHEAVSANPFNIAVCPLVLFVFEKRSEPGKIIVGYREPITGPSRLTQKAMAKIEKLLDDVAKSAVGE